MTDHITDLLRELRPAEAERAGEIFPSAQRSAMLQAIFEDRACRTPALSRVPRREHKTTRWWRSQTRGPLMLSALGAGGALAVALIVLLSGSAVRPTPAVAFTTQPGGAILARVTEPFAAQKELEAAFAARGLQITVQLIPVSPGLVGRVVYLGSEGPGSTIETLQSDTCESLTTGRPCPIGVKIPAGFTGSASIAVGRPARSGEGYESSSSSFGAGELLHCSGLLNNTVSAAASVLAADNLSVVWNVQQPGGSAINVSSPPSGGYVSDALPIAPGKIRVFVHPSPATPGSDVAAYDQRLNQGCLAGGSQPAPPASDRSSHAGAGSGAH